MANNHCYLNNNAFSKSFSAFDYYSSIISQMNCIKPKAFSNNSKCDSLKIQDQCEEPQLSYLKQNKIKVFAYSNIKKDNNKRNKSNSNIKHSNNKSNDIDCRYSHEPYLKKKIEEKKEAKNDRIFQTRKPQLFCHKQHIRQANKPKILIKSNSNLDINKLSTLYKTTKAQSTQSYSQLYFKPEINKVSLEIAERLEPSKIRLTKKKKKLNQIISSSYDDFNVKNRRRIISKDDIYSKTSQSNIHYLNTLYLKGVSRYQMIQHHHNKSIEKQTNEYQLYSYKPDLSLTNKSLSSIHINNKRNTAKTIYQHQTDWQSFVEKKTSIRKGIEEIEESHSCTFKPKTTSKRLPNDDEFIKKYLNQINDYVYKRRKLLQTQSSSEKEMKNINRNTICFDENKQENNLILKYNNKLTCDKIADQKPLIQIHCSNSELKKKYKMGTLSSIDLIEYMRTSLNIKQFFEEGK